VDLFEVGLLRVFLQNLNFPSGEFFNKQKGPQKLREGEREGESWKKRRKHAKGGKPKRLNSKSV